jgi:hypothetical protein
MTEELQKAYSVAGDEMGTQMAAAVVAIVQKITSGQGMPGIQGWTDRDVPEPLRGVIPADVFEEATWIIIVSAEVETVPLFQGKPIWTGELTSGHRLLVLG